MPKKQGYKKTVKKHTAPRKKKSMKTPKMR